MDRGHKITETISEWADVNSCPVCSGSDVVEFMTDVPPKIDRPTTSWKLCQECSHLFCSPRPTDAWLDAYYKKGYRHDTHGIEEAADKVPAQSAREEIGRAMRIVAMIEAFRGSGPFRRHLDIGSSTGALLASAMDKFKVPNSTGVEPNDAWRGFSMNSFEKYKQRKDVEDPHNMDVKASLSEVPLSSRFDLVTISHTIEHIQDLVGTVQTIRHVMFNDGVLYVEVPFSFGGMSDPLMFPHIHGFTIPSLTRLLEQAELHVHRIFLEGSAPPFWPPHQHLVVIASPEKPSYIKDDVLAQFVYGRDAARTAAEMSKKAKPTYELG